MRTDHMSKCGLIVMLFLAVWNAGQAQDSLGMRCVSTLDYWSGVYDLQMVDSLAYISSGYSGLRIMDLSDPTNPVEIGRSPWSPWDYLINIGVYVKDSLVYLTYDNEGRVLDVSDPTHPTEIHHWYLGYTPIIRFVYGNVAVGLSQETRYPYVMDVSDWNNVQVVGDFPNAWIAQMVEMVGDYLCIAGEGVKMYDISDPWNPVLVASVGGYIGGSAALSGYYVYLSTLDDGVHIYDVSDPLYPVNVSSCDSGDCGGITLANSHLFISKGDWGFDNWDITDPTNPLFSGTYALPLDWGGYFIASSGNLLCAALDHSQHQAVAVLDISNPASPMEVSRFGKRGNLRRIVISGINGYLSDVRIAFHVIDLTDPPSISEIGSSSGTGIFMDLAVQGDYAYAVDYNYGLIAYSVADPVHPESLSCWQNVGHFHPGLITVVGNYAYVIAEGYGLYVFSLANPGAPVLLDSVSIGCSLIPFNGYLYGCQGRNFYVISLADPTQPQIVGSCVMPFFWGGMGGDIAFAGHYAYVAYYEGGVQIIDIANPEHPTVVGSTGGSYVTAIAVSGNTLAFYQRPLNYQQAMIYIIDLTDPIHPQYVGRYNTIEEMSDMEIYGSYLLTVSPNKFAVYQVDALCGVNTPEITPSEFALYPCYPNPFNSVLTIPFAIPVQNEVIINIYNILGQRVQEFALPTLSPGMHRVLWNSRECASGIYLIRMVTDGQEYEQKVVLLK